MVERERAGTGTSAVWEFSDIRCIDPLQGAVVTQPIRIDVTFDVVRA